MACLWGTTLTTLGLRGRGHVRGGGVGPFLGDGMDLPAVHPRAPEQCSKTTVHYGPPPFFLCQPWVWSVCPTSHKVSLAAIGKCCIAQECTPSLGTLENRSETPLLNTCPRAGPSEPVPAASLEPINWFWSAVISDGIKSEPAPATPDGMHARQRGHAPLSMRYYTLLYAIISVS